MRTQRTKRTNQVLDIIESLADLGIRLGAVAFVLSLAYIIYGLMAKNGFVALGAMAPADKVKVLKLVYLTGKLFWISGAVVAFSVAIRYYVEETLGYVISLLGVLLYLGTPYLFNARFAPQLLKHNLAMGLVVNNFRALGMTLFIPGMILILRHVVLRLIKVFKQQEVKKVRYDSNFIVGNVPDEDPEPYKPRPYSACWQMPYCRTFIRGFCPAHEAKKSCWRLRKGCMCDGDIIMGALKARSSDGSSFHKELMYRGADSVPKTALTARQKRMRCRMCIIFDFHQTQKYKLLSPLAFPLVFGVMWFGYPKIAEMLQAIIKVTDSFMKVVQFTPDANAVKHIAASSTPEYISIVFVVWLGIIAISYVLRFLEFCIFSMKI